MMKKIISYILIFVMILSLGAGMVFGASYGKDLQTASLRVNEGTTLHRSLIWNDVKNGPMAEHYLEYEAGQGVVPIAVYGNTVYGTYKLSTAVAKAQEAGWRVLAAINGDFYNTANGVPTGVLITEGILRCSENSKWSALGFLEDGTAKIGRLDLSIRADSTSLETGLTGMALNRPVTTTAGVSLFTADYNTTDKSTIPTVNVLLTVQEGEPRLNGTMTARVESVFESEGETPLSAGQVLLSVARDSTFTTTLSRMYSLIPGEIVTFSFTGNEAWNNVPYVLGGGDTLLSGGQVVAPEGTGYNPRTAVGITPEGKVILYTVDGRLDGYSVGASEYTVAERLLELGCTEAINMDGGGSTALHVIYPGDDTLSTVNKPSTGTLRPVSNYIFLVTKDTATGELDRLHVYPYENTPILAGATQTFTVKGTDENYYPVPLNRTPKFSVSDRTLGTIDETGLFTAGTEAGTGSVIASVSGAEGSAAVTVVKTPDSITLIDETTGKPVGESIVVAGESSLSLKAQAVYNNINLVNQDNCFTWTVEGPVGAIDPEGTFTTTTMSGDCVIRVAAGDVSTALKVKVEGTDFFFDMLGHWAREFVNTLYKEGVVTGSARPEGGLLYKPDNDMTRAEFAAVLSRWLLLDVNNYADVELPFADAASIPSWAVPYVKCVYGEGIVKGNLNKGVLTFNPNSTLTRQEAMTMIGRTTVVNEASPELTFDDSASVAAWALPYVKTMVERGVISGSGNKLRPLDPVTRSQVAKIIYTLDRAPEIVIPETPAVPEEPAVPAEPEVPETPETPAEPVNPEVPVTPEAPEDPEAPVIPETDDGRIPGLPDGL